MRLDDRLAQGAVPWSRFIGVSALELALWFAAAALAALACFEEAWPAASW